MGRTANCSECRSFEIAESPCNQDRLLKIGDQCETTVRLLGGRMSAKKEPEVFRLPAPVLFQSARLGSGPIPFVPSAAAMYEKAVQFYSGRFPSAPFRSGPIASAMYEKAVQFASRRLGSAQI